MKRRYYIVRSTALVRDRDYSAYFGPFRSLPAAEQDAARRNAMNRQQLARVFPLDTPTAGLA